MYHIEHLLPAQTQKLQTVRRFLADNGLAWESGITFTVAIWEKDTLVATGSLEGPVLKCIAVDATVQGQGYTSTVVTQLTNRAFEEGYSRLFLYTKPGNEKLFSPFGFYKIAATPTVVWMENRKNGPQNYILSKKRADFKGTIGCIVANANPFTNGHLHLVKTACRACDFVYLFIVSEDNSVFSFADRFMLAQQATKILKNLAVVPTDAYMVSAASFPSYFLKDPADAKEVGGELDVAVFVQKIAKPLGITRRFVGEEPFSPITAAYNASMLAALPQNGIQVTVVPRLTQGGVPISATTVRRLYNARQYKELASLVPPTTYQYLVQRGGGHE